MTRGELQQKLTGACILAPLTKGGNLPFRRLCVQFGADVTFSEMAYARKLVKRDRKERALLRRHSSESCFGVQIAARQAQEAAEAGRIIEDSGADFIDINCGCPIDDTTRRGLGAALLRRPRQIAALVEALNKTSLLPITVKIRTGWKDTKINAKEVARLAEEAGAAAITVHGRSREQRYTRAADWELIRELAEERSIPVIGNGDIITHFEAELHLREHKVAGVMLARGALIKPWLFAELKESRCAAMSPEQRIDIYFRLSEYLKEHFGSDELGTRRIMNFLPWHIGLFARYQHFSYQDFAASGETSLIHRRASPAAAAAPLDALLSRSDERSHHLIAAALLSSASSTEALELLNQLSRDAVAAVIPAYPQNNLVALG